ncbi:MAG: SgcJ/EcaC family oxidoreductase [Gemmatimonadetes bacterium]|nr:SgcJ/EcaC family oxidoreductase [Gemmatimonadota bacterium]
MKLRLPVVLVAGALALACAGETGEQASETAEMATMAADEAAIDQIRTDYLTHYNMHHAPMVADMFADSAVFLGADGTVAEGKAAILANLEADMAGSPTLSLTPSETQVLGDAAVARGTYSVTATPEAGTAMTLTGNYMTAFMRENGTWKIFAVVTNFDAPPPEDLPRGESPAEPPPENGTLTSLYSAYTQHHNLGHAPMVADLYTEDAFVAFPDAPAATGRAAIEASLAERMAQGNPQLTIHAVGTEELGEWAIDGGWYEVKTTTEQGETTASGAYMLLARRAADGSWKIHWLVSNGRPAEM